eukprot:7619473-Alexandrium_andersonii.AAC.1
METETETETERETESETETETETDRQDDARAALERRKLRGEWTNAPASNNRGSGAMVANAAQGRAEKQHPTLPSTSFLNEWRRIQAQLE